MRRGLVTSIISLSALAGAACGNDPSHVTLGLDVEYSNGGHGILFASKPMASEEGDPYGAFIDDARKRLGKEPSRIGIDGLSVTLVGGSDEARALEDVFVGTLEVSFIGRGPGWPAPLYPVGSVSRPTGEGPVALDVAFDADTFASEQADWLRTGDFTVSLRSPYPDDFHGGSADVQLTFILAALE